MSRGSGAYDVSGRANFTAVDGADRRSWEESLASITEKSFHIGLVSPEPAAATRCPSKWLCLSTYYSLVPALYLPAVPSAFSL